MPNGSAAAQNARKESSFSDLILRRFSKEIETAIRDMLEKKPGECRMIRLKKAAICGACGENALIAVLSEYVIKENGTEKDVLCLVTAESGLGDGFHSLWIKNVYPGIRQEDCPAHLPDNLIPIITDRDLDRIAEKLLACFCPFLLTRPGPVPVESIAKRLGLTVRHVCIDPKRELLGAIFFSDAAVRLYDESGEIRILPVSRKTILVNCSEGDSAQSRNTVMHECLHWILHRFAFTFEKELRGSGKMIACRRPKEGREQSTGTLPDRMEWQANALAPRILLPASTTKIYAEQWLKRMDRLPEKLKMERLIDRVSAKFKTSRTLTKIRLIELGFESAKIAFTYTDKKQYEITPIRTLREYRRNTAFQRALQSGQYVYAENCFVLRDAKFLERAETGELRLTRQAKQNREKCCLAFLTERKPVISKDGMYRGYTEDTVFIKGSAACADAAVLRELTEIMQKLPETFPGTLSAHMERKRYTDIKLADASLLSAKSIHRYRTDPGQNISMGSSVALCVGLRLHPVLSYNMVGKTPNRFTATVEHTAYQIILQTMTYKTIYECNDFLKQLGLKPLTKKEE